METMRDELSDIRNEQTLLASPESGGDFSPVAPQWAENDTILPPKGSAGPVLMTLEPTG